MTAFRPVLAVLVAALVGVLAAPSAHADDAHETLKDFLRTGKFTLFVNAKEQKKARVYHSRRAGAYLIVGSSYDKPILIQPREKLVSSLTEAEVVNLSDKKADVAAKAKPEKLGAFELQGRDIVISLEKKGLLARMKPRPYALGAHSAEELLLHTPDYERVAQRYRPRASDVQKLVDCAVDTEVVIFFGTWCPTCKRLLPRVLRVDQDLEESKIKITYYGLPKGKSMRRETLAKKYGVRAVPIGVILVDGKRVGTLNTRALSRPEGALCTAVKKAKAAKKSAAPQRPKDEED